MLIFNGKKYFVPFIGSDKVVEVALPTLTVQNDEGELMIEAYNDQKKGCVLGGKTWGQPAYISLTSNGDEVTATCRLEESGETLSIKKSVDRGSLPPLVMVFDTKTGVVQAIVSFEEGGTQGYIDYTSGTSGTYDVSKHIDAAIIKKGETLFGKVGTYEGGVTIDTCNLTIKFGASVGYVTVVATKFENGETKTFNVTKNSGDFSIQNVVCGSVICIGGSIFDVSYDYAIGNISSNSYYLVAPTTAGDYTATIIEYED